MSEPDPVLMRFIARPFGRRVFSLTGAIPLGAFLLLHAALNARALRSHGAFANAMRALHSVPLLGLFEWVLVFVPLLVHAGLGVWLVVTRTPFREPSPYPNPLRIAVRATGIAAIGFLALHLPGVRFRTGGVRLGGEELATVLASRLSSTWHGVPWEGVAYLLGTACVTFHFAAGMWAFFVTTRDGKSSGTRRSAAWVAATAGAAFWILLANVVVFRATGAKVFGQSDEQRDDGSGSPCPPVGAAHRP